MNEQYSKRTQKVDLTPDRKAIIGHDDVKLCRYDPRWAELFEEEQDFLISLMVENLGQQPQIYHVGGTSINGMTGKPIIDILLLLPTEQVVKDSLSALVHFGDYTFLGDGGRPGRYFLSYDEDVFPFYLHVTTPENQVAKDQLRFKKILQNSNEIMRDYISIKQQAAEKYPNDRTAYRIMKGYFIDAVLRSYEMGLADRSKEDITQN